MWNHLTSYGSSVEYWWKQRGPQELYCLTWRCNNGKVGASIDNKAGYQIALKDNFSTIEEAMSWCDNYINETHQ